MNNSWHLLLEKIGNFQIRKGLTSFVNPYSMLVLKEYPNLIQKIDYWHVDGISLVKYINHKLGSEIGRFSFDDTSVAPTVFSFAKEHNLSVAIVGTKEGIINQAVKAIETKHKVSVNYFRNGYFNSEEHKTECYKELIEQKIDLVICGMGTPYQENFLIGLQKFGWNGYGFTCGGYLHQIALKDDYYPRFFDELNIRWLYRIIDEPKLLTRYLIEYPKFYYKFREAIK